MKQFLIKLSLSFFCMSSLVSGMEPNQGPLISAATLQGILPPSIPSKKRPAEMVLTYALSKQSNHKKVYSCDVCSKEFPYPSSLANHRISHTNQKSFICTVCGQAFHYKFSLKTHVSTVHANEKPFACNLCPYASTRGKDLKTHMISHSDERNYECRNLGCNKFLPTTSSRSRHEKKGCKFKKNTQP